MSICSKVTFSFANVKIFKMFFIDQMDSVLLIIIPQLVVVFASHISLRGIEISLSNKFSAFKLSRIKFLRLEVENFNPDLHSNDYEG